MNYRLFKTFTSAVFLTFIFSNLSSLSADELKFVTTREKSISLDLVKEAFKRMGQKVDITVVPWARALEQVRRGTSDAIFTAYKKPERELFLDYSNEVLLPQKISVFVSKKSGLTAKNMNFSGDPKVLTKYTLGTRLKVSYGKVIDKMIKANEFQKIEVTNKEGNNFRKLVNGRVDILIMNRYLAWHMIKKLNFEDQVVELEYPIQNIPSYIAFSKANKLSKVRDKFDETFKEMVKDGTFSKVIKQYTN